MSTRMDHDWMDRDGQRWHVRAYNSGGAMGTEGQIPDAGKDMIRFRRHDSSDGHAVNTRNLRDPNEMNDEELQQLLDQAKRGAEELEGKS